MSRAMNLKAPVDVVERLCNRHSIGISTIEPLESGGTRVVVKTAEGALALRRHAKTELIDGPVKRSGLYHARPPVPYG